MTDDMLKDTTNTTQLKDEEATSGSIPKKPRTSEDFYLFCKFILEYENYNRNDIDKMKKEEALSSTEYKEENDVEETVTKESPQSLASEDPQPTVAESSDEDSYDLVTCFCQKPFAGRPMIECSSCLTWIHLRCAKVKKSEIPDVFLCAACKERNKVV